MSEVVADPTDDGTLRPNVAPEPTGDYFEPLNATPFEPTKALPPDVETDNPFAIWSLFFTTKIMEMIVNATNSQGRCQVPVVSLSNQLAKTQLFRLVHRQWFDLTI
jgi:hypothetical protein